MKDKKGRSKIPVLKSRLFWAGVIIKLFLALFFASEFLYGKFAPFADYFIANHFANPYDYFSNHSSGLEFPYPPLMLFIFSLPRLILSPFTGVDPNTFGMVESFIYRIPLFIADLVILFILMRWLKTRIRQVLVWYWLSPVLIYINYFHGQLDAIPIALLFVSLYFLFRDRWLWAFVALGAAVACKTNMVVVIPFYILYQFRHLNRDFKSTIISIAVFCFTVFLINLPFIGSTGFIKMVYNNPVQNQVFDLFYQFNANLRIYFIPAIFFVIVLWYYTFKFVNRDQLTLFLTFSFLAFTLMVAPMQGWYYWIFPMLIYFVIKQGFQERQIFLVLNFLYFVYFFFIPTCDYFNSGNIALINDIFKPLNELHKGPLALNVSFTLLQTTLLLTGVLVYRKGIISNVQMKFLSQPYLIGIGGDSAAGKSTLSHDITAVFSEKNTTIIRGDDMHRWERGSEYWKSHTHLDPRANKLHTDLEHTKQLKTGKGIHRQFYDHATGKFTLPKFIRPNKLILFEGLHSFYLNDQSEIYDLKIYMEPQEELRRWWKVKRDVLKRNYTPGQVINQIEQREEDSEKYIRSQKSKADIVISFYTSDKIDLNNAEIEPSIAVKVDLPQEIQLDNLLVLLNKLDTLSILHEYANGRQVLNMRGDVASITIAEIAWEIIPELEEIGINEPQWKGGYEGLLQLITVHVIFNKISLNTLRNV